MRSAILNHELVLSRVLVNASWKFTAMETRFFTALLARLRSGNLAGEEVWVPLDEVLAPSRRRPSEGDYAVMARMLQQLTQPRLLLDSSSPFSSPLSLLAYAHYEKQRALLRVRLSPELLPYFARPSADDTRAPLEQLLKLRTPAAYHFYWLVCECAAHGTRLIELRQLAWRLGVLADKINPSGFRQRILDSARQQLEVTDLPCKINVLKRGKSLHLVHILFPALSRGYSGALDLDAELGQGEVDTLLNGLLMLFRFVLGAACAVAAAATTAAG